MASIDKYLALSDNKVIKKLFSEATNALTYLLVTEQQALESQLQDLKLTNMIDDFIINSSLKR